VYTTFICSLILVMVLVLVLVLVSEARFSWKRALIAISSNAHHHDDEVIFLFPCVGVKSK